MPTSKEFVSNKPLQGVELAAIILSDVQRMLDSNGLLSGQTAYSRIAYDLRLTLHLDLPSMPLSEDHVRSRPVAADAIAANPALAAVEPLPLVDPSPAAILDSTQMTRDITSPNLARVEHSLPITVEAKDQDGHTREELVSYLPQDVGMKAEEFVEPDLSDVTAEQRKELGL